MNVRLTKDTEKFAIIVFMLYKKAVKSGIQPGIAEHFIGCAAIDEILEAKHLSIDKYAALQELKHVFGIKIMTTGVDFVINSDFRVYMENRVADKAKDMVGFVASLLSLKPLS